ncbi:hypothetical protein AtEden1_Chr5g0122411 [Arabidopsis thaliana]
MTLPLELTSMGSGILVQKRPSLLFVSSLGPLIELALYCFAIGC